MAQTNYVYSETLSGTVDWVNKVFTSAYEIDRIDELNIWGVTYTDFSFTWNVITLTDAPSVVLGSPKLSYFKAWVVIPTTPSQKTFLEIVEEVYQDVWQNTSSLQYPISMVRRYVKETLPIHLNKKVNPIRKVGSYSFNKAVDPITSTYVAGDVNCGHISQYTPSSGKLLLWFAEEVSYSSLNWNSFTGTSGLSIVYQWGTDVSIAYAIPDGVQKVSEVIVEWNILVPVDFREFIVRREGVFCVHDGYIFLPRTTMENTVVTVTYTRANTAPDLDSDILDFEPDYTDVLRYDVERKLFVFREDSRLANVQALYTEAWKNYRSYIAKQVNWTNSTVRSSSFKQFNRNR